MINEIIDSAENVQKQMLRFAENPLINHNARYKLDK